jgi:AhpD family alkylhydroperoxidase
VSGGQSPGLQGTSPGGDPGIALWRIKDETVRFVKWLGPPCLRFGASAGYRKSPKLTHGAELGGCTLVRMATLGFVEYKEASPEVRAVYDDILATRKTDWINNFWKALAHDPASLKRTWESIKQIMAPGALDALTKEMIYLAVSVSNQCPYCIASHTAAARKAGMSDGMFQELMAVVGMANETNRLVSGYQVEIDEQFKR